MYRNDNIIVEISCMIALRHFSKYICLFGLLRPPVGETTSYRQILEMTIRMIAHGQPPTVETTATSWFFESISVFFALLRPPAGVTTSYRQFLEMTIRMVAHGQPPMVETTATSWYFESISDILAFWDLPREKLQATGRFRKLPSEWLPMDNLPR